MSIYSLSLVFYVISTYIIRYLKPNCFDLNFVFLYKYLHQYFSQKNGLTM